LSADEQTGSYQLARWVSSEKRATGKLSARLSSWYW